MKKINALLTLLMFAVSLVGISNINLENIKIESRENFNREDFSSSSIQLENSFGQIELLNLEKLNELIGIDIQKINLVYSQYQESPSFDQKELNKKRIYHLIDQLQLKNLDCEVEWNEIGIRDLNSRKEAKNQFHGFIIEYKAPIFHHSQLECQQHMIDNRIENTIIGVDGTIVRIPANAFLNLNNSEVHGQVAIHLKEAIHVSDFVLANLSTLTNSGEVLESGGMVEVTAFQNGSELKLKDDQFLAISIPKDSSLQEMPDLVQWQNQWNNGQMTWTMPRPLWQKKTVTEVVIDQNVKTNSQGKWTAKKLGPNSMECTDLVYHVENGILVQIDFVSKTNPMSFHREDFDTDCGQVDGIDVYQAQIISRWFENNNFDHSLAFSLWSSQWFFLSHLANKKQSKTEERTYWEAIYSDDTHTFKLQRLGWCNIDRLARFQDSEIVKLEIEVPEIEDFDSFNVMMILPNKNVCMSAIYRGNGKFSMPPKLDYMMPKQELSDDIFQIKMPYHDEIVFFFSGTKDEKEYFSSKKSIVKHINNIELIYEEVCDEEMNNLIAQSL